MKFPKETEILEIVDAIKLDPSNKPKEINISVIDKNITQNISSNKLINLIRFKLKKTIKYFMYLIYRIIYKVVKKFLKIVDPRLLDIISIQENLREENYLIKEQILKLKEEVTKNAK